MLCVFKMADLKFLYLFLFFLFFREWEKEVYRSGELGKDPSFLWAIVRSFGLGYSMLGLVALIHVS